MSKRQVLVCGSRPDSLPNERQHRRSLGARGATADCWVNSFSVVIMLYDGVLSALCVLIMSTFLLYCMMTGFSTGFFIVLRNFMLCTFS